MHVTTSINQSTLHRKFRRRLTINTYKLIFHLALQGTRQAEAKTALQHRPDDRKMKNCSFYGRKIDKKKSIKNGLMRGDSGRIGMGIGIKGESSDDDFY